MRRDHENRHIGSSSLHFPRDGKPIQSTKDLSTILEGYKVGDTVKVQLKRNGQDVEVTATLDAVS